MCVLTILVLLASAVSSPVEDAQAGITLHRQGNYQAAEIRLRHALETWPAESKDDIAVTTLWLVETVRSMGEFGSVEALIRSALAIHPASGLEAELRARLAVILKDTGRADESRKELMKVLDTPGITAEQQIDALIASAELDRNLLHLAESLASLNKALDLAYSLDSKALLSETLQGLGMTWIGLRDVARAESALNRALAIETSSGASPHRVATALQRLAALHAKAGKYGLAEDELTRALEGLRETVGRNHPQIGGALGDLAEVCRLQGKLAEAASYAFEAHATMVRGLGPDSPGAAETLGVIARIEAQSNKLPDAAAHYSEAIASLRTQAGEQDYRVAVLMNGYASVLSSMHRGQEAKQVRTEMNSLLPRSR